MNKYCSEIIFFIDDHQEKMVDQGGVLPCSGASSVLFALKQKLIRVDFNSIFEKVSENISNSLKDGFIKIHMCYLTLSQMPFFKDSFSIQERLALIKEGKSVISEFRDRLSQVVALTCSQHKVLGLGEFYLDCNQFDKIDIIKLNRKNYPEKIEIFNFFNKISEDLGRLINDIKQKEELLKSGSDSILVGSLLSRVEVLASQGVSFLQGNWANRCGYLFAQHLLNKVPMNVDLSDMVDNVVFSAQREQDNLKKIMGEIELGTCRVL